MGCGGSRDDEASLNSRRLDVQIAKDARVLNNDTKMLLLGPGESGKSTLFKQMKILAREGGYSEAELIKYKGKWRLGLCGGVWSDSRPSEHSLAGSLSLFGVWA